MADLSVVVVTYNSADCIGRCLEAATRFSDDVIVVDNASKDRTLPVASGYPGVRVMANPVNRGFGGAVNQGFAAARHRVVLILNPDTFLHDDPAPLADACLSEGYAGASGVLVREDGTPQHGFAFRRFPTPATLSLEVLGINRLFPSNPVNRRYRCLDLDPGAEQDVEQPAGAFLAVRKDAWAAIGGFDEGFYPIWFEDVDFCLRLSREEWRIRYVPGVQARHLGAASIRRMPAAERQVQWYVSLLRYAAKHFGRFGHAAVAVSVALSSVPRAVLGCLRFGGIEPVAVFAKVLRLAIGDLVRGRGPSLGKSVTGRDGDARHNVVDNSTETEKTELHVP